MTRLESCMVQYLFIQDQILKFANSHPEFALELASMVPKKEKEMRVELEGNNPIEINIANEFYQLSWPRNRLKIDRLLKQGTNCSSFAVNEPVPQLMLDMFLYCVAFRFIHLFTV